MAEKRERFTSPAGVADYPWLNQPDTKFNAAGVYRVKVRIPSEEAADFAEKLDKLYEAGVAEMVEEAYNKALTKKPGLKREAFDKTVKYSDKPYKWATNDEGDETGELEVTFKSNASYLDKKTGKNIALKVHLFDAKGAPSKARIGGGSTIKVSFQVIPFPPAAFGTGISLRLNAVQVLDLVTFGGGANANSYGFAQEEGYEATDESEDNPFATESTDPDAAEGDDPNF